MKNWGYDRSARNKLSILRAVRCLSLIAILLIGFSPCFALKLENISFGKFPIRSNFHIGVVNGIGNGLNIGASALYFIEKFGLGLDIEQIMSDINYSATINATRFGGIATMGIGDLLRINYHIGIFNFMPSAAIHYKDADGGDYILSEATNYKGNYWALSADYGAWDFIFTLKFVNNAINGKGTVREIDLNIGKDIIK